MGRAGASTLQLQTRRVGRTFSSVHSSVKPLSDGCRLKSRYVSVVGNKMRAGIQCNRRTRTSVVRVFSATLGSTLDLWSVARRQRIRSLADVVNKGASPGQIACAARRHQSSPRLGNLCSTEFGEFGLRYQDGLTKSRKPFRPERSTNESAIRREGRIAHSVVS